MLEIIAPIILRPLIDRAIVKVFSLVLFFSMRKEQAKSPFHVHSHECSLNQDANFKQNTQVNRMRIHCA